MRTSSTSLRRVLCILASSALALALLTACGGGGGGGDDSNSQSNTPANSESASASDEELSSEAKTYTAATTDASTAIQKYYSKIGSTYSVECTSYGDWVKYKGEGVVYSFDGSTRYYEYCDTDGGFDRVLLNDSKIYWSKRSSKSEAWGAWEYKSYSTMVNLLDEVMAETFRPDLKSETLTGVQNGSSVTESFAGTAALTYVYTFENGELKSIEKKESSGTVRYGYSALRYKSIEAGSLQSLLEEAKAQTGQ